jgi:hypothetical protein
MLVSVLCAHLLGLNWLQGQLPQSARLALMADPMFTRIIRPTLATVALHTRPSRPEPSAGPVLASSPIADEPQPVVVPEQIWVEPVDAKLAEQAEPPAVDPGAAVPDPMVVISDGWPADTRLSYRLGGYYRGNLYGSARVQWQREASRYQVRVDLSLALLRVSMTSQGEVRADALLPQVYEEQFPWGLRRLMFDGAQVRFDNGVQMPQPPALQDTASQFVELTHRFASGREELKVGRQVKLWLARPQGMALWTYDVVDEELLQTPELGSVSAFHLRPRPIANPTGVITAELWFAPTLQYLPVRVRVDLGEGNFVDLLVERIEQGSADAQESGLSPRM